MKEKELHEKAVHLSEGGIVEVAGLFVRAIPVNDYVVGCEVCQMDCLCRGEMTDLCAELCAYDRKDHYLVFA